MHAKHKLIRHYQVTDASVHDSRKFGGLLNKANTSADADAYPGAGLGADPSDVMERTRLNEALADLVTNIHDAWSPVYVPDRFITAKQAEDGVRQAAFGQLDKQYTRLDHLMADREWMVLGRRTVADAYLYVMCSWKDRSPTPLANYPALAAFKDRLATDEGVRRAVSDEPAE
jgi:glutathione S-transferase